MSFEDAPLDPTRRICEHCGDDLTSVRRAMVALHAERKCLTLISEHQWKERKEAIATFRTPEKQQAIKDSLQAKEEEATALKTLPPFVGEEILTWDPEK